MPSIDLRFTGQTNGLQTALTGVQSSLTNLQRAAAQAGEEIDSSLAGAGTGAQNAAKSLDGVSGAFMDIEGLAKKAGAAVAGYFAVDQIMQFGSACLEVRKEFESLEVSFATLLGSETAGKQMFNQLTEFATKTPMMEKDIASAAQTLLGFNISAEKVVPMLKAIGDVSMGDAQKFQSLSLAFAQATSAGKLMGQDLMQMINAGFNPLGEMSRTTGKSISELKEQMEKGGISAKMLEEAFVSATSEGGKYNGMLEAMSKTLQGAQSNLEGAIQKLQGALGKAVEPIFVAIINKAYETTNEITEAFEKLDININADGLAETVNEIADALRDAIVMFGAFKAAEMTMAAVTMATKAWGAATQMAAVQIALANKEGIALTKTQGLLAVASANLGSAFSKLNKLLASNVWALAAMAVAKFALEIYDAKKADEDMLATQEKVNDAMDEAGSTYTSARDRFLELKKSWEDLGDSLDARKKFVTDNKDELEKLGLKVTDVASAERVFGNQSKSIVKAFELRAKAAAAAALATDAYQKFLKAQRDLEKEQADTGFKAQDIMDLVQNTFAQIGVGSFDWSASVNEGHRRRVASAQKTVNGYQQEAKIYEDWADDFKKQAEAIEKEIGTSFEKLGNATTTPASTTTKKKNTKKGSTGLTSTQIENNINKAKADLKAATESFNKALLDSEEKADKQLASIYNKSIGNAMAQRIDAMEVEHEAVLKEIEANKESERKALIDAAKVVFDAHEKLKVAEAGNNKKNVSVLQFSREALEKEMPEYAKTLEEQLRALSTSAENATLFEHEAFAKQWRDLYDELMSTSEDYLVRREALEKDYGKRIAEAQVAFDRAPEAEKAKIQSYIAGLQKQMQSELATLDNTKFQEMVGLDAMLGNVEGFSRKKLDEMAASLEKIIEANKDITPEGIERIKTLQEALSQLYAVRAEKNPAKEIEEAAAALKKARAELDTAESNKDKADAAYISFNGKQQFIGDAYKEAEINGRTAEMAKLREEVVKVGDAYMKYGDVLQLLELAENRYAKAIVRSKTANEKAFEQFQKTMGVMSKASRAVGQAGDLITALGTSKLGKVVGVMGEIGDIAISAVNDIKSTMVEASKSIADVSTAAAEGAQGAAAGAAASMSAVEKASVILTIISAAIQVATKIVNLTTQMHNDSLDSDIKKMDKQLDKLQDKYEDLGDAIKKSYAKNAVNLIEKENDNLKEQNRILEEQMRLERLKKEDDEKMQDALKVYEDKIRDNNKLIEENKEAAVEAIMGEDVQSAIERFADAYADAWTGEGSVKKTAKKAVRTMMQNMVQEALKQDLSAPVTKLQERLMQMYGQKGFITEQDIASFEKEAEEIASRLEKKYGFADKLFEKESDFNGTSGAFQTMSQESADELNGRFAQAQQAVQGTYDAILEGNGITRAIGQSVDYMKETLWSIEDGLATANGYLFSIEGHAETLVKKLVPSLERIEGYVKER